MSTKTKKRILQGAHRNNQKVQGPKQRECRSGDGNAPAASRNPPAGGSWNSCQRAEAVLLASPLPVVTLDLRGTVQSWNPAAEQMFGWSPDEVLGNPFPVVPQEEAVRYRYTRETLMRGRTQSGNSVSPRKKDGSRFPAILSTAPLFDSNGRMNGSLHIFQPVAEERRPDRRMIEELQAEAIERFAHTIAHEFNNSVGAILGWAELALEGLDPQHPLRRPLGHILQEARHASNVTRELAAFSRRQGREMYSVDLNHVAEQASDMVSSRLPPGIVIKKALTPNLPRILADPEQIARVLMDLCLFSREAMPDGGALQIETGQAWMDQDACRDLAGAAPGNYAVLCISHGGTRMDEETLRSLLEPFSTAPRDGIASGLGLAMVYEIVKQHGGFISVSSVPDRGTRLQVYLPAIASHAKSAR